MSAVTIRSLIDVAADGVDRIFQFGFHIARGDLGAVFKGGFDNFLQLFHVGFLLKNSL